MKSTYRRVRYRRLQTTGLYNLLMRCHNSFPICEWDWYIRQSLTDAFVAEGAPFAETP